MDNKKFYQVARMLIKDELGLKFPPTLTYEGNNCVKLINFTFNRNMIVIYVVRNNMHITKMVREDFSYVTKRYYRDTSYFNTKELKQKYLT